MVWVCSSVSLFLVSVVFLLSSVCGMVDLLMLCISLFSLYLWILFLGKFSVFVSVIISV